MKKGKNLGQVQGINLKNAVQVLCHCRQPPTVRLLLSFLRKSFIVASASLEIAIVLLGLLPEFMVSTDFSLSADL